MGMFKSVTGLVFAGMFSAAADAAVITYDFTATVSTTELSDPESADSSRLASLPIHAGAIITGTFRYDTAMKPSSAQSPVSPPYLRVVRYENPEVNFLDYSVNGFHWASMPSLNAQKTNLVRDSDPGFSWDEVQLRTMREDDQLTSFGTLDYFAWGGDVLNSTNFPETFDLGYYFTLDGWFDDLRTGGYLSFNADITSLTRADVVDVPEPGAPLLLMGGLLALAGACRRRQEVY